MRSRSQWEKIYRFMMSIHILPKRKTLVNKFHMQFIALDQFRMLQIWHSTAFVFLMAVVFLVR